MDETSSGQYYHNPSASFLPNSLNYNNNVFQTLNVFFVAPATKYQLGWDIGY